VIDKSIKYVISCQNPDGGFSYQSPRTGSGSQSGFARSAAGVAAGGSFDPLQPKRTIAHSGMQASFRMELVLQTTAARARRSGANGR